LPGRLVESITDYAIFLLGPNGQVASWHAGAEAITGYRQHEVDRQAWSMFYSREDVASGYPERLLHRAKVEDRLAVEHWMVRKDGARFWADLVMRTLRNPTGEPVGFTTIIRDCTERKQAEKLYRLAVEASPAGLVAVDGEGRILLANRRMAEIFGYEPGELEGLSIHVLLPAHLRERHERQRLAFDAQPSPRPMGSGRDLRGRRKDGVEIPVEVGLNPIVTDGQRLVLASVLDITDRKQAERSMAEREARVRALMDNASDGISIITRDGIILEVNHRMAEILGHARESIAGRHISEFTAPAALGADPEAAFRQAVEKGSGQALGIQLQRPDESVAVVDFSISTVTFGSERIVLSIGRDITRQRQLERQLQQAQRMEAVGRLAGGVAHDFNNLLTAIIGTAELMKEDLGANPGMADLDEIVRTGNRAADLTRQLLAFSRQQVMDLQVMSPNDVVHGAEKLLRRLIGEDIELTVRLDPGAGLVMADPAQLEQVIMNLAVNARDAMPQGGRLDIETGEAELDEAYAATHADVRPGTYVLLTVSDNGTGMTPEVQSHLFEPFFTTKEPGKGTGLGLATVYGIIRQCGGHVAVYSEIGRGTAFKVYLPRTGQTVASTPPLEKKPSVRGGSETILLVEDDPGVRSVARRVLERDGYRLLEAMDPAAALALSDQHQGTIAMLVTDVVMPGMSGPALASRLLALRPGLRVLYTSGYTREAIVHHGVLEPGVAFLQKPYTTTRLARTVREVLDRR
jgi:PAS domain S-box-containing protein